MAFTLTEPCQLLEEIKKSRFLTQASHINSPMQANSFIEQVSNTTATHNCWAWKIGQLYRFNDAGEPSGTAGRPILTAIEGQQCDQIVVVVTRWFGGIKLGTGGLARAYGGGTARCLQQANLMEIIPRIQCSLHCYYNEWPLLESRLNEFEAVVEQQEFDAQGTILKLGLPETKLPTLQHWISNLTKGRVLPELIKNKDN